MTYTLNLTRTRIGRWKRRCECHCSLSVGRRGRRMGGCITLSRRCRSDRPTVVHGCRGLWTSHWNGFFPGSRRSVSRRSGRWRMRSVRGRRRCHDPRGRRPHAISVYHGAFSVCIHDRCTSRSHRTADSTTSFTRCVIPHCEPCAVCVCPWIAG